MDLELYLKQLRAECQRLDNTIAALEAMAIEQAGGRSSTSLKSAAKGGPKRRGRPPGKRNSTKQSK